VKTNTIPVLAANNYVHAEICYNLKYIVLREEVDDKEKLRYTTRKTGVWSRYSPNKNHIASLLVNPPEHFNSRLKDMLGDGKACDGRQYRNYMDIHILQLSCAGENWSEYISELEEEIEDLVCALIIHSVRSSNTQSERGCHRLWLISNHRETAPDEHENAIA